MHAILAIGQANCFSGGGIIRRRITRANNLSLGVGNFPATFAGVTVGAQSEYEVCGCAIIGGIRITRATRVYERSSAPFTGAVCYTVVGGIVVTHTALVNLGCSKGNAGAIGSHGETNLMFVPSAIAPIVAAETAVVPCTQGNLARCK